MLGMFKRDIVLHVFVYFISEFAGDLEERICPEGRPGEDDLLGKMDFFIFIPFRTEFALGIINMYFHFL